MLPWVDVVYPDSNSNRTRSGRDEFSQLLMEVYGKAIISEMFSVIIGTYVHFSNDMALVF